MATTAGGQGVSDAAGAGKVPHADDSRSTGIGGGIAQTLRDSTYKRIDEQKARASDTLGSLAGAVRGMSQPLRDSGQQGIADYVTQAADGIERWASDLQQKDLEDALRAVQTFARRQPALFLGVAFTAGVLAVRFLKTSGGGGNNRDWNPGQWQGVPSGQFATTGGDLSGAGGDYGAAGGDYGSLSTGTLADDSMGSDVTSTASPRPSGRRTRSSSSGRSSAASSTAPGTGQYETPSSGDVQFGTTGGSGTGPSTTGRTTGEVS